ncbi:MAG: cobalamin B12-binding domain-containing protein [Chloroflexi bacterium]|nr:cobalamin B12-binding domain-containing protein [Chloroflexota bacterium]
MKILLVYTNTNRMLAPAPLGASLVASRLRRDGHVVRFVDLMFARAPAMEAAQAARELEPDLVCYSIRNVDNQSSTEFFDPLPTIKSIVSAVRAVSSAPTILGGTAFTSFPVQFLDELGADYGIAGDDLDLISQFVASLSSGKPSLTSPGLVYRDRGKVIRNPFTIRGYADTPFDGWGFIDLHAYRRSPMAFWDAGLVTRTGRPFKCVYCDTYKTSGREWVSRDLRRVAEEAAALQRRGGAFGYPRRRRLQPPARPRQGGARGADYRPRARESHGHLRAGRGRRGVRAAIPTRGRAQRGLVRRQSFRAGAGALGEAVSGGRRAAGGGDIPQERHRLLPEPDARRAGRDARDDRGDVRDGVAPSPHAHHSGLRLPHPA